MGRIFTVLLICALAQVFPSIVYAQGPDCSSALTVCSSSPINFTSFGPGIDDFSAPGNDDGCLSNEHQSAWFYFELDATTPLNSQLLFTITPTGGVGQDYDFAVFGPTNDCANLGAPVRCSWASSLCGFCPDTGLGNGETDVSEGASGNGYVAPMSVNAGQGYFLLIDNFSATGVGFTLTWSGPAAPHLDCTATPNCNVNVSVAQPSIELCQGSPLPSSLSASFNGSGAPDFTWTATGGGLAYLSNPNILNPSLNLPANFSGSITYTLTAEDGSCSSTASVQLTVSPIPVPGISGSTIFCAGETVTLTADPGYNSYNWSSGDTGPTITVTDPGTYTVTVKNAQNCSGSASITIDQLPAPQPIISGPSEICTFGSGILTATPGFDTYQWSNNSTGNTTVIDGPGTYEVTVTDNGCQGFASFVVTESTSLNPEITGDLNFCQGGSTLLDAGGGYASYSWSNNTNNQSLSISTPGFYSVTVQDATGCTGEASVFVSSSPNPQPVISATALEICPGNSSSLEINGGFSPIVWSTAQTGPGITVNQPGVYSATVTDVLGCEGTASITIQEAPAPEPVITGIESICPGETLNLGLTENYASYQWSVPGNGPTVTVSTPGTIGVTVTDANGCFGEGSAVIPQSSAPQPAIQGALEFCEGTTTTLTASPGFSSYAWSTSSGHPSITVNAGGQYTVTVTNAEGCAGEASVTVSELIINPPAIDAPDGLCPGETAQLTAQGNYATYAWSSNQSGQQISVSQPGNYQLTVTDNKGCMAQASVNVAGYAAPQPVITGTLNICQGGEPSVLNAGPGYAGYSWSTDATSQTIVAAQPGDYSVTVSSLDGCTGAAQITVGEFPSPTPTIDGPASFCEGQTAQLAAEPGYQSYLWSTNSTNPVISVQSGGQYSVVVTDQNGCQGTAAVNLVLNPGPEPVITGDLVICNSGATGQLAASPGYATYLWSTTQGGQNIEIDSPGNYGVTVTAANGCSGETAVQVTGMPNPTPVISGDLGICPDESTELQVSGGNYASYAWSNSQSGSSISVGQEGAYAVTVTDVNGCQGETSASVYSLPSPEPFIFGPESVCEGSAATLDAGTGFDNYSWSTNSNNPSIQADQAGVYSVTVTNAMGCTGTAEHELTVNPAPFLEITGSLSFCTGGATTLSATEGFESYLWSTGSASSVITVSTPGTIILTATDENGCQVSKTVQVQELTELAPSISGETELCPGETASLNAGNGFAAYQWSTGSDASAIQVDSTGSYSVTVTDIYGCSGSQTAQVVVHSSPQAEISGESEICQGQSASLSVTGPDLVSWNWAGSQSDTTLTVNAPGIYVVTAQNQYGCEATDSFEVVVHPLPQPVINGPAEICPGVNAALVLGSTYESYSWTGGIQQPSLTINQGGVYEVAVTDTHGCSGSASFDVGEFIVTPPLITGQDTICPGTSTQLSGPAGQQEYAWSTGSVSPAIVVGSPGNYTLTVTDQNGCISSNAFVLGQFSPVPPAISAPAGLCAGDSALVIASPGYQDYTWSNGLLSDTIMIFTGGNYQVSAVDGNGCQVQQSVSIIKHNLPTVQIGGSASFCIGGSTVLNAGNNYAAYKWSTGDDTQSITVNQPGDYALTVTDAFGCRNSDLIQVNEDTELSPEISGQLSFCEGNQTILDAGNGFLTYSWSTGDDQPSISVDTAGSYSLTVTDAGGCTGSATVQVSALPLPSPEIAGDTAYCAGSGLTLAANPGYSDYEWSAGGNEPNLFVNQPGIYGLTVTDGNGCKGTASIGIAENPLPGIAISGPDFFCAGQSAVLEATPGFADYQWSSASGNDQPDITVTSPGNYQVTITNEYGCASTAAHMVSQAPLPLADAGPDKSLTCSSTTALLGGSGSSAGNQYTYEWTGPGINGSNGALFSPVVAQEGLYTLVVTDTVRGCVSLPSEAAVTLNNTLPEVAIADPDSLTCAQETVTLTGSVTGAGSTPAFQWLNNLNQPISGAGSATLTVSDPQSYTLVVVNPETGCKNQSTVTVSSNRQAPNADAGPDQLIDCFNTYVTLDAGQTSQGPDFELKWTDKLSGSTLQVADPVFPVISRAGEYELTVTNLVNGCRSSDVVSVFQDQESPVIDAGQDQVLDCHASSVILEGAVLSGGNVEIEWSSPDNPDFSANTPVIETDEPGQYLFTVVNPENGCRSVDQVEVTMDAAAPTGMAVQTETPTCFGDQDGSIFITGVTGGTGPYLYSINESAYSPASQFGKLTGGQYQLSIQDAAGCTIDTLIVIPDGNDLAVDLGPDQTVHLGDPADIRAQINIGPDQISILNWKGAALDSLPCNQCTEWSFYPQQTVSLGIQVTDINGCIESDDLTIFVNRKRQVFIPNAFSPDGDGENDILYIAGGKDVALIKKFLIFNRWGEVVFEVYDAPPNDPAFGWDGNYRSHTFNAAVFVYLAEIEFIDGEKEIFKGDITLMR
ncbi:MAG: gliding motility-associated C-terminal domain-containing protein [Lewinellaceae bacterium]|nr:gliding motility-associated C-terminal domain-containing protein [Lewinellaceae bacterium]